MAKICLNMIVKNESRVIHRILNSVVPLIDYYCICDTGSTDDTIELITTFFKEKNIPGKIVEEPFQDFGYNRSFAIDACKDLPVDYLLLLDADMILWINPEFDISEFKNSLPDYEYYYMFQGSESYYYKNTRIVKNNYGFKYKGVTHEYVDAPKNTQTGHIKKKNVFIMDIGDGGSKANKFARDVHLLRKGIEQEPDNDRYHFYLGNSLKDSGEKQEAIRMYQRRIELGGWIEEVWHSYYNMGHCYKELGNDEMAINSWMEAYAAYPNRIESLYEIVKHYRIAGKCRLAHTFYEMAKQTLKEFPDRDHLFLQKDVYDYKLEYELSIYGYYFNPTHYDLAQICMNVLQYAYVDDNVGRNILSNYKFYAEAIIDAVSVSSLERSTLDRDNFRDALGQIGKTLGYPNEEFVSSTPCLCKDADHMLVMQRFVNYRINSEGGYDQKKTIDTVNILAILKQHKETRQWFIEKENVLQYDQSFDNMYVGLEDMRIFVHDNKLYYTANRGLDVGNMVIEHGQIDIDTVSCIHSSFPEIEDQREIEKNWVMFSNQKKELCMVYNWHPFVVGQVTDFRTYDCEKKRVEPEFKILKKIETPYLFKYLRGSTCGVPIRGEIWFLCHAVSYEDRRYYYHILVAVDSNSMNVKKYTKMFTFEKEKVEYCLGFSYHETNNEFLFGYSKMDKETHYLTVHKSFFDERTIYLT